MPDPLKNIYNEKFVTLLGQEISAQHAIDSQDLLNQVFDQQWEKRELKDRMMHIAACLRNVLPDEYGEALKILMPVSDKFTDLEGMIFPGYVELFGLDHFELSMSALEYFTSNSSSEFAVRPFILKYPEKMISQLNLWAKSDNHHVRRLASEGCRPRLPWAIALPEFKQDPNPVLSVLETLRADESEYVRRSVANNLNDIAKDNPQITIRVARQWYGENEKTDRLVKHACRTLLKQGESSVLDLFGFESPKHIAIKAFNVSQFVKVGQKLEFEFELSSERERLGKLRIEYAIGFVKQNGRQARKVFHISESISDMSFKKVMRAHSFKKISTRKYYPGKHDIALIINGIELATAEFNLISSSETGT